MNSVLLNIITWVQSERGDFNPNFGWLGLVLVVIIILYLTERAGVTNIFD